MWESSSFDLRREVWESNQFDLRQRHQKASIIDLITQTTLIEAVADGASIITLQCGHAFMTESLDCMKVLSNEVTASVVDVLVHRTSGPPRSL